MSNSQTVDPSHFLRSFLVVAGHYVLLLFGLLMGMFVIAFLRFPNIYRLWNLPEQDRWEFDEAWESNPELLFPTELCIWMIGLAILLSIFVGLQVAFWAPFSKSGHGIFLAIVMICTYLQISITTPQIPKWMMVAILILSPTMVVVASRLGERWFDPGVSDESISPDSIETT